MADDDMGEKTEAPTAKRRMEAREQGNIAKSPDLTSAVLLIAVLLLLHWYGTGLIGALKMLMEEMLSGDWLNDRTVDTVQPRVMIAIRAIAGAMAPLLLGVMLVAVVVNMMQVGLFFSFQRIQPQLTALNPFKGLGKLFAKKDSLIQMAMNIVKLILLGWVAYSAVRNRMDMILATQGMDFIQIFGIGGQVIYSIAMRIGVVLLILAFIDYAWHRWRTEQQLKMSKQEVKEEMRRMEGDPQIKSRRRQMAMQRILKNIRKDVPTADVIVTNPTEFAVALKYDSTSMHAPKVVAKGTDFLAMQIRQIAIENGIPILERPPLARAIYRLVDVGQEIPDQFYSAVAEILAYVYELSGKVKQTV